MRHLRIAFLILLLYLLSEQPACPLATDRIAALRELYRQRVPSETISQWQNKFCEENHRRDLAAH